MAKFKDEKGNEVEAFTKEEAEAAAAERAARAVEEFKASPEFKKTTDDLDAARKRLTATEEQIKVLEGKDANLTVIRQQKDQAEKDKKELEAKIEALKTEVIGFVEKKDVDEAIHRASGNNTEVEKKIRFHFDRLTKADGPAKDREEAIGRIKEATVLATGRQAPGPLTGHIITSAGGGGYLDKGTSDDISPELKELTRKVWGALPGNVGNQLTDDDFKKYVNRDFRYQG